MTRMTLPWLVEKGPSRLMPDSRSKMPVQEYIPVNADVRLEAINRPGVRPHFHVHSAKTTQLVIPERPNQAMQVIQELTPMGLMPCDVFQCEWFLYGREGESEGKPFRHPAGVACGDFERCSGSELEENCPCPGRVLKHMDGRREGHVAPCRYCDPAYRLAVHSGIRTIGVSESVDRLAIGIGTLIENMKETGRL